MSPDPAINHADALIVGTGHAGAHAASALRQRGFTGSIAMIGEEPELPYERPPLSKAYLAGKTDFASLLIRAPAFWQERAITVLTGRRAVAVDPEARRLTLADGTAIGYGDLIWAAGGHARRLACSGHDLAGVHTVRCRADVEQLRRELPHATRIAVIGGGYIGLEAAAVLQSLGKHVTILEAQDRVLARVAGTAVARFFAAKHRAHGVEIHLNTTVHCIEERNGRAAGVRLANGTLIPAELVIVGIGIVPAVEPLLAAGTRGGNGVAVDELGRTSLPHIHAAGDCALHANRYADGMPIRLESVQNATDMATCVAKAITGAPQPYTALPWFWSDQYDVKLQTVGLAAGHDTEIVRGDPASGSFSVIYLKAGHVAALDCVNATRDYVQGRALVQARARIAPETLADTSRQLAG